MFSLYYVFFFFGNLVGPRFGFEDCSLVLIEPDPGHCLLDTIVANKLMVDSASYCSVLSTFQI